MTTPSRSVLIASALIVAGLGGGAPAVAKDTEATWLKRPTPQDLMAVWPTDALRRGQGGRAKIICVVTLQGALRDCRVESESPAGAGFGAAAIALTPQFLMKPATKDGKPVVSEVGIPITFAQMGPATGSHLGGPGINDAPPEKVLTRVRWLAAPSVADVRDAYPAEARAARKGGQATLDCRMKDGGLTGCSTLREEPAGADFARAAKSLTGKFRGPTQDSAGKSLNGAHVQVRFTFAPETLDSASPLVGKPDWTALPEPADFASVLPEAAKKAGVLKARVVLACKVAADGGLTDCHTLTEEPAGLGYGEATRTLTRAFKLGVWSAEGLPTVGGTVRVPLRFDLTDTTSPPAAKN